MSTGGDGNSRMLSNDRVWDEGLALTGSLSASRCPLPAVSLDWIENRTLVRCGGQTVPPEARPAASDHQTCGTTCSRVRIVGLLKLLLPLATDAPL